MRILIAWLGNTDLRASDGDVGAGDGPILSGLKGKSFDRAVLLSNYPEKVAAKYVGWVQTYTSVHIQLEGVKLRGPTDFEDIYRAASTVLAAIKSNLPQASLTYHLSPGTPAMAAVWILLSKTRYPAELVESSREQGVRTVSFPFDLAAEFTPSINAAADHELERLAEGLPPESPGFEHIIHRSGVMKQLVARAKRLAAREVPVLIQGESGTGKELFARAIHQSSARAAKPFLAVNCGAIPNELVDSTLFGHEKGSFTGANQARVGQFEAADGGTLFLDEIGELPFASQVRLLRVLQEREVTRVGATQTRKVDVRIVAATNRTLPLEVQQGRFREDLFHRLAVGVLVLPPLRDREGDIGLLLDALMSRINHDAQSQPGYEHKNVSVLARNILLHYTWPGNIRELYNTLLRASVWASANEITKQDVEEALAVNLPPKADAVLGRPLGNDLNLQTIISDVARHYLRRAMKESQGNKTEAARLVGLSSYQTLSNWLEKYEVQS
jgi:transcriptional regulator with PAS, ATPase and Fis domain